MIVPLVAQTPHISCKLHDILLEYRPLTVNALEEVLDSVIPKRYKEYEYDETYSGILECDENCDKSQPRYSLCS